MKKYFGFILLLFISTAFIVTSPVVSASETASVDAVDDQADILNSFAIELLNERIAEINSLFKGQLFIVTTDTNTRSIRDYADDYLRDKIGNNSNGSVFVIDMGQREFYVSTSGNMIDYVTDKRLNNMLDEIGERMASGSYYSASLNYIYSIKSFVNAGIPKKTYRIDEATGKITYYRSITMKEALFAFGVALFSCWLVYGFSTAGYQLPAGAYKKKYSYDFKKKSTLEMTSKNDQLVDSFVTTKRISRNDNDNFSSGSSNQSSSSSSSSSSSRSSGSSSSSSGSTTHSSGGGTFGGGGRSF